MFYKFIRLITSIISTLALCIIAYTLYYFVNNGLRIHGYIDTEVTGGVEVGTDSRFPLDVDFHLDNTDPISVDIYDWVEIRY